MLLSSASVGTIFANSFEKGWIGTVLLTRLASPLTPSCEGPVTNLFRRLLLAPRCVSSATHRKPPCFTSSDSTHSFFFFNLFFLFESRLHCYLVWIIMQYKYQDFATRLLFQKMIQHMFASFSVGGFKNSNTSHIYHMSRLLSKSHF